MARKTKIFLLVRSKYTRDSLAALMATLPEAELSFNDNELQNTLQSLSSIKTDVIIIEGSPLQPEMSSFLHEIKLLQPKTRTMLLVEPLAWNKIGKISGADLVLPMNVTAGEMLMGIRAMIHSTHQSARASKDSVGVEAASVSA